MAITNGTHEEEAEVPLPSAPLVDVGPGITFQRPLTFRGHGPGLIAILPNLLAPPPRSQKPLDPEPVQKWAEEGFAVVGIVTEQVQSLETALKEAVETLHGAQEVDEKSKVGLLVYDPANLDTVLSLAKSICSTPPIVVSYGASPTKGTSLSVLSHVPAASAPKDAAAGDTQGTVLSKDVKTFSYSVSSPHFVLPQLDTKCEYAAGPASVAHTRSLKHVKKYFDGPWFDLETIWDEHTAFEFADRAVAKTMGTMVQEPYVNHVPVLTGGIGRKNLTDFYRNHFIFNNPKDTELELLSRTEGIDRIIDEFIFKCSHSIVIDWLLPGVPPTGKYLQIPFVAVVNIRGDRLYHERIWWDGATAMMQAGILPSHVPFQGQMLRLPAAGAEQAAKMRDPERVPSNVMMTEEYGLHPAAVNGH